MPANIIEIMLQATDIFDIKFKNMNTNFSKNKKIFMDTRPGNVNFA